MKKTHRTTDQIIEKLREADVALAKATGMAQQKAQQEASEYLGIKQQGLERCCESSEEFDNSAAPLVFSLGDTGLEPVTSAV